MRANSNATGTNGDPQEATTTSDFAFRFWLVLVLSGWSSSTEPAQLQHFDASKVDPSLAAMMASKLKTGAIGAAGLPRPDQATQDAFFNALDAKSRGSNEWTFVSSDFDVESTHSNDISLFSFRIGVVLET